MSVYYFNITYMCNSNCIFCAADHPLSNDNREISLEQFNELLEKNGTNKNDRVIINGGEPTMHHNFWQILDAVKNCGAKIDLFTNGKVFKDVEVVKKIVEYNNIHLRIPLFGSTGKVHDKLTGVSGNFNQTVRGLDLLCQHLCGNMTLEIKLLLSKITVMENEKIYDLIRSRWTHNAIRISLNPLLLSTCVIQHKDIMIEPYDAMMIKSEPLIRRALEDGVDFSVALIPYCSFPNRDLIEMCHGRSCGGKMFYAAPGCTKNIDNLSWRKTCVPCYYVNECNGFPQNYISYFGEHVMKPFCDS